MEHDLTGKVAVVVGGGQTPGPGIGNGRAISLDLARHGATVVAAAQHLDRAQTTVDAIKEEGGEGWAYELNVIYRDQVAGLFKAVKEKYGRIDIMVYNVGVNLKHDFATNSATLEDINHVFDVDLVGCIWSTLECAPIMVEQETGGSIVNISSISSKQNGTGIAIGFGIYALSKAGMNHWSSLSASHYAPLGVRINTLILGPVTSSYSGPVVQDLLGGTSAAISKATSDAAVPLKGGRKTVWETAHAVTFLSSDEAKFITGTELAVDGGVRLRVGPDPEMIKIRAQRAVDELEEAELKKGG